MSHKSTREKLLAVVDDYEIVSKELIENALAPKHQKISSAEHTALVELLVSKDEELKKLLALAAEQETVEETINELRVNVDIQDSEIQKLQRQLKEAEQILATAIFQARQKLASIAKANQRPVNSEELIKYAHRISAADAVCAPLNWMPGDIRRPYPTDIEMRMGLLGKSELNLNGSTGISALNNMTTPGGSSILAGLQQHGNNLGEVHRTASTGGLSSSEYNDIPNSTHNQFSWNQMGDLHMSMGSSSVSLDNRHKDTSQDDVEVMSTDSSSSSSSDSQ
ncbi:MED4 family protein [Megaselia abdita]